jgi:hypothetical protein
MTTTFSQDILFRETQSFPRWLVLFPLVPLGFIWTLIYVDSPSWIDFGLTGFIFLGTACLLIFSKLETEVRRDGLYVRFAPFHFRFHYFAFADIASVTARRYSPIGEYGGWGLRYGLGGVGRAYNVSGDKGVQLVFRDGQRLLIGSQHAEELARLIQERLRS